MALQNTETVALGEIKVSKQRTTVFSAENIGTGVVVTVYDMLSKVAGIAHVILPESTLVIQTADDNAVRAKFADLAVPALMESYYEEGGQLNNTRVRMFGGAQLFNFGGGSGNLLNIGARNGSAIQTAMSRMGLAIDKSDLGGNKARNARFVIATGQLIIHPIGGQPYPL